MAQRCIGELTANLPFDDPLMENLFGHAEKCGLPVLFHIGFPHNDYGVVGTILGLPRLEGALHRVPQTSVHRPQPEMVGRRSAGTIRRRFGAPGRRRRSRPGAGRSNCCASCRNLFGDLSAASGQNASCAIPAFGYRFLEEFQDKLFFGTDYCCRGQRFILSEFLDEGVETGRISQKAYNKICRENLLALVGE